jgi:hypothetical protein
VKVPLTIGPMMPYLNRACSRLTSSALDILHHSFRMCQRRLALALSWPQKIEDLLQKLCVAWDH